MLADRLLTDPDALMRTRTAELLALVPSKPVIRALRQALGDAEHEVRAAALMSLLKLNDIGTLAEITADLRSPYPLRAIAAARLLGEEKAITAVPSLLDVFHTAKSEVAGAIAQALGSIGDQLAVPALCMALDHRFVAATAASALGCIGDERAIAPLTRALRRGRSPALRAASARALGSIPRLALKRRSPAQVLAESRVVPALRHAMDDPDRLVRINASIALWQLGARDKGESSVAA